jgi:hypothetical protein
VGFGPLISSVTSPVRSRHLLTTEQNRLQLPSYIQFFGISMGGEAREVERAFFSGVSGDFGGFHHGKNVVNLW